MSHIHYAGVRPVAMCRFQMYHVPQCQDTSVVPLDSVVAVLCSLCMMSSFESKLAEPTGQRSREAYGPFPHYCSLFALDGSLEEIICDPQLTITLEV